MYDNQKCQKGKIIQKVKWDMEDTGQISASKKAKQGSKKKKKSYFIAMGVHICNS